MLESDTKEQNLCSAFKCCPPRAHLRHYLQVSQHARDEEVAQHNHIELHLRQLVLELNREISASLAFSLKHLLQKVYVLLHEADGGPQRMFDRLNFGALVNPASLTSVRRKYRFLAHKISENRVINKGGWFFDCDYVIFVNGACIPSTSVAG